MRQLRSVLNAAARLIYGLRACDHITDTLISLHWLRVPERIQYKLAVLTHKVLHGGVPTYLGPLVCVTDQPGRRSLRSADSGRLVVPPIKLSTVGSRAFPVAAAELWNCLPDSHFCRLAYDLPASSQTLSVPEVLPGRYSVTSVL